MCSPANSPLTLYRMEPLHYNYVASQEGHCEVVRILLEAKADVNMKDDVSESCSHDSTVIVH